MKKYLFIALALMLVLMAGSVLNVYAGGVCAECGKCQGECYCNYCVSSHLPGSCGCGSQLNPDVEITVINPTPTPVTYYPDYDEEEESAAPAPVEEASPKTGDSAVTAAAMLVGLGAAAVVRTCVRRSRA